MQRALCKLMPIECSGRRLLCESLLMDCGHEPGGDPARGGASGSTFHHKTWLDVLPMGACWHVTTLMCPVAQCIPCQ